MKKKDPKKKKAEEAGPRPARENHAGDGHARGKPVAEKAAPAPPAASASEGRAAPESAAAPGAGAAAGGGDQPPGMDRIMASLSKIFGDREFLSDDELDAFLESKIASGELPPSAALDPLDEAQSLVYEAWNSPPGPAKIALARRALEVSANCADAYVILAEEGAEDRQAALDFYRKGVEAGERALDPALFIKSPGKFWELMETRPYMRARLGLAECLWDMGRREEGLVHLRDLLRLNPADDQGVRYILIHCLLELGAEAELGALLDRFHADPSPEIKYTHALWTFRREGASESANALLAEALQSNRGVPGFLMKKKKLPKRAPDSAREGSEEEAAAYAMGTLEAWHKTLGALEWLAERAPD